MIYLGGEAVEDGAEALAAVLIEEEGEDDEGDGEARGDGGVLEPEDPQRDDLGQHQREHRRVVHDRPHPPPRLVLRAVHVQNLPR